MVNCDLSFLHRKKRVDNDALEETKLARVLNTLDLTALGIGSTLGAGKRIKFFQLVKIIGKNQIVNFYL